MNNKFNMKKFIAAILFGVMVLTLTACGNSEEAEEDGNVTLQFSIWSDEEFWGGNEKQRNIKKCWKCCTSICIIK